MGPYRQITLFLVLSLVAAFPASSQSLSIRSEGDHLHVAAPKLHFLSGAALEKLRNGSTVSYIINLTAIPSGAKRAAFMLKEKFVISFDLWEEKYSVVQDRAGGRAGSRLTAPAAEAWCLDNMPIPVGSVPDRQPFMIMLGCFIEDHERNENGENPSTLTLAGLIEVFSRKKREEPLRWEAVAGPFLLEELRGAKYTR